MQSMAASGASVLKNDREAALEATRQAMNTLGSAKPIYGFAFASPGRDVATIVRSAQEVATGAEIVACTTAGEITERGLIHGGVAVMLVSTDATAKSTLAGELRENPKKVADRIAAAGDELRKRNGTHERRHMTTVVLVDGLAGTGENLVLDLYERGDGNTRIVGGAAGDEGKFEATHVATKEGGAKGAAAALHVMGRAPWGVGVNHGLRSTTKPMRVTKAEGNVVFEIDGEPAFKQYVKHAEAHGQKLTPQNAAPYLIANELGIHFFDKINRVRAPLSVGTDGSLSCAAEIPKGSMVSILDAEPKSMVEAASLAAKEAKRELGGRPAAGVLLFDCVCRGMILGDGFDKEVTAVREVFGDVPIAGFLTYGEIARYGGNLDGWHNSTAVVVAIPA